MATICGVRALCKRCRQHSGFTHIATSVGHDATDITCLVTISLHENIESQSFPLTRGHRHSGVSVHACALPRASCSGASAVALPVAGSNTAKSVTKSSGLFLPVRAAVRPSAASHTRTWAQYTLGSPMQLRTLPGPEPLICRQVHGRCRLRVAANHPRTIAVLVYRNCPQQQCMQLLAKHFSTHKSQGLQRCFRSARLHELDWWLITTAL